MAFLDETGLAEVWNCADNVFSRIERGSYKGSNTYGASNPNRLTLGFVPMVVIVMDGIQVNPEANKGFVYINGMPGFGAVDSLKFSLSGKTLSWYNSVGASQQYNDSNSTYYYVAFG